MQTDQTTQHYFDLTADQIALPEDSTMLYYWRDTYWRR
jgi:hypothetical protein